jgi:membrane protein
MAIGLGAEFNSAIEEMWPAHPTRRDRRRGRRRTMARLAARIRPDRDLDAEPPAGQDSATRHRTA